MTKISVEIVPRNLDTLKQDLLNIKREFPEVDIINIPELLRCDIHSWEGAGVARQVSYDVVPHIRAIDLDYASQLPMRDYITASEIDRVLVVNGDPPQDMGRKIYPTVSTDIIAKFKEELPEVQVYACIDQYRGSMWQEEYSIRRKLQAGAVGFFTQPFYDLRYVEMYYEMLGGKEVYWGVSPVLSERSVNYWETKNKVIFPEEFKPTLAWNVDFARRMLEFVQKNDTNIYFMPIAVDVFEYLRQVLR